MKGLGVLVLVGLMVLGAKTTTADRTIRNYYLSNYTGQLRIMMDIDWMEDRGIDLDRNITMEEAIKMVEQLNNTLPK